MPTKKKTVKTRTLVAKDIMTKHMFTLRADSALQEAIRLFVENHVSAAPVFGTGGEPVGVLTKTDIARYEWERRGFKTEEPRPAPEHADGERVSRWMTPFVLSVEPDTAIVDVARAMVKNGVHHLFVKSDNRLLGVISSFDLLRVMSKA
ncbi:MAG: CBS domain-containing protein [Elusimicrobia bacterium]|nr:CBS domain-containing protein [Elusimicrobiota bacterium]